MAHTPKCARHPARRHATFLPALVRARFHVECRTYSASPICHHRIRLGKDGTPSHPRHAAPDGSAAISFSTAFPRCPNFHRERKSPRPAFRGAPRLPRLKPLASLKLENRGWTLDVLNAMGTLGKSQFDWPKSMPSSSHCANFTRRTTMFATKSVSNSKSSATWPPRIPRRRLLPPPINPKTVQEHSPSVDVRTTHL